MKKYIMVWIWIFFTIISSSCYKHDNVSLVSRIEKAINYIDPYFDNDISIFLYLPENIAFDSEIDISYITLSPDIIDNKGKTFQNQHFQKAKFLVILSLDNNVFEKIYYINVLPTDYHSKNLEITFINIGQGDSILIELPNGEIALIDA